MLVGMQIRRREWIFLAAARPTVRRELFIAAPGAGTAVMAYAYYTGPRGGAMTSVEQRWSRSDTIDTAFYRRSQDNGRTWSSPVERKTRERRAGGTWRMHPRAGWVDPRTGRLIEFWLEGVLPSDDPLEGLRQWRIFYRVGEHGPALPVGPLPGVWTGKNSAMIGDQTCRPLGLRDGRILVPICISPLAADGSLANPGGGYTWHDAAVLHGRWRGQELEWELSELIRGDPQLSTRGWDEPTLAELHGGRLMMVLRGSNDRKPELPGRKWVCFSEDTGRHWSPPRPWTYRGGKAFYSPSACSQLLRHSNGRLYWLGNITAENPRGNRPRYPFHIGEVDRQSGELIEPSVQVIDDLAPGENPQLTLSNFLAREDRATGEICVHMTRLLALPDGWQGDALLFRIPVRTS